MSWVQPVPWTRAGGDVRVRNVPMRWSRRAYVPVSRADGRAPRDAVPYCLTPHWSMFQNMLSIGLSEIGPTIRLLQMRMSGIGSSGNATL